MSKPTLSISPKEITQADTYIKKYIKDFRSWLAAYRANPNLEPTNALEYYFLGLKALENIIRRFSLSEQEMLPQSLALFRFIKNAVLNQIKIFSDLQKPTLDQIPDFFERVSQKKHLSKSDIAWIKKANNHFHYLESLSSTTDFLASTFHHLCESQFVPNYRLSQLPTIKETFYATPKNIRATLLGRLSIPQFPLDAPAVGVAFFDINSERPPVAGCATTAGENPQEYYAETNASVSGVPSPPPDETTDHAGAPVSGHAESTTPATGDQDEDPTRVVHDEEPARTGGFTLEPVTGSQSALR